MALSYQQWLHNVALRLSALVGTQVAALNTTYDTATLTSANFKSADWPFNSFRDAILMAEGMIVEAAASAVDADGVGNHPWRNYFGGVTSALTNPSPLPVASSTALQIVGAPGQVYDSSDSLPLSPRPIDVVRRLVQQTWRVLTLYHYCIEGGVIEHTRTSVIIRVCVFDRSARLTAWNAAGNSVLPDAAEALGTALAVSLLTRDGAFAEQAERYANFANAELRRLREGSLPDASLAK